MYDTVNGVRPFVELLIRMRVCVHASGHACVKLCTCMPGMFTFNFTLHFDAYVVALHSSVYLGPQQIRCISNKFKPEDFEGHSDTPKSEMRKTKSDRRRYYQKLGSTKFGVNLPGLGYDCFRLWELLTLGTIVVMERGVGLDRTVRTFTLIL